MKWQQVTLALQANKTLKHLSIDLSSHANIGEIKDWLPANVETFDYRFQAVFTFLQLVLSHPNGQTVGV